MGSSQDVPRSEVDAIDVFRSGASESESKKGVEAGEEGQETSHPDGK